MLKPLNTVDLNVPWTRWFLYGDTRSGKTSAASTFPKPLFLVPSVENSVLTLAGRNFDYYTIKDRSSPLKDGAGGMDAVLSMIEKEYFANPDKFPYMTIVVDGLTHYMELVKDELSQGSKVSMDVQKYDRMTAHIRNVHARLSNLEMHTVYCALAQVDDAEKGDAYLSKKVKEILPSSCEVFAHLTVKDQGKDAKGNLLPKIYTMHTQKHGNWKAGTRYKRLPPEIKDFRFADIQHLLTNLSDAEQAELEKEVAALEADAPNGLDGQNEAQP